MPELPEVERFRTLLLPLVDQTVQFEQLAPHRGISGLDTVQAFACRAVVRKGKQICVELEDHRTLCVHMGMTGSIRVRGQPTNWGHADAPLQPEDEEWPPRFAYLSITTTTTKDDDHYIACFCDPRKFGRVYFVDSSALVLDALAPDGLDCCCEDEAIVNRLAHQRLSVKALLLDQKRVVSGVGNWVADEVLYQMNLHPEQSYLTVTEARAVLTKLQDILRTAVECLNADAAYPKTWLFGHRWTKQKNGSKDFHKVPIRFITVGGRTSAIVASQTLEQRTAVQKSKSPTKPSAQERTDPTNSEPSPSEPSGPVKKSGPMKKTKPNATNTEKPKKQVTKKRSMEDLQQFRRSPRLAR